MSRTFFYLTLVSLLIGCSSPAPVRIPVATATIPKSAWSTYDPDPSHPWNRVFRALYRRTTPAGTEYGFDELDPLLWFDTTHLLDGPSHAEALQALDAFLSTHAENLIHNPLKRALFQHDLWAVFDWLAFQSEPYPSQRRALETRLVQIMHGVALSKEEIDSLPDNYALELGINTFPSHVSEEDPDAAFLPADLFQSGSAWVPMGREGGPIAMTHTEAAPFFGRSVFLPFVRSPQGRASTLAYIESLNHESEPVTPIGSDVALVRRMLLIDDQGQLQLSPLVETIQLRHFAPEQHFHEFELDRARLFENKGGLILNTEFFMLFMSHGDVFEGEHGPELYAAIPQICQACHSEYPPILNSGNTHSILSYSRQNFPLPDRAQPVLFPNTWDEESQVVIDWKRDHATWKSLQDLWE